MTKECFVQMHLTNPRAPLASSRLSLAPASVLAFYPATSDKLPTGVAMGTSIYYLPPL